MLLFIALFILCISTNSSNAIVRQTETKKIRESTITFSSSYFEKNYTNGQIGIFGLELMELMSRLNDPRIIYRKYSESSKAKGLALGFVSIFINTTIMLNFNSLYHENGHGLRYRAFGGNYILPGPEQYASEEKKSENFFKSFFTFGPTYDVLTRGCPYVIFIEKGQKATSRERIIVSAGGINNQTYLSEITSNKLHSNGFIGISEFISYLFSIVNITLYSLSNLENGDPILMEKNYRNAGIKANRYNLFFSYTLSTILSGTTYSFIEMFRNKNIGWLQAKPIEFKGFRMPDVFSYITTKGISYKIVSGYTINQDFKLLFGTEFIGHGKFANEFNLGLMKSFFIQKINSKAIFKVLTFFGQGFNIELSCSIPFYDRLSLNFGGGSYSNKSLHGERHSMDLININGRSKDFFVSLSYRY